MPARPRDRFSRQEWDIQSEIMGGSRQGPFGAIAQMRERVQNRVQQLQAAARPAPAPAPVSPPASLPPPPPALPPPPPPPEPRPPAPPEYTPFRSFAVPDFGSQLYGQSGAIPREISESSGMTPSRPRLQRAGSRNPTAGGRLSGSIGSPPATAGPITPVPNVWNSANANMAAGAVAL